MKNLSSVLRGLIKGGSLGIATPFIESYQNINATKNANGPKAPHSWYSIFAQIIAVCVVIASEPGRAFIESILAIFK